MLLAAPLSLAAQRINPMIPLHEKGLPAIGVAHPTFTAGRGGGGGAGGAGRAAGANAGATPAPAPAPAAPDLAAVAKETVDYKLADYIFNTWSTANAPRYGEYMRAILAAGGSVRTHPFVAKIPIVAGDEERAIAMVYEQLNYGQIGLSMQRVESPEEVRRVVQAMRFKSKGGTRPETGFELAAAYWGLTPQQYLEKADVWPINPNGELVLRAIIESVEGIKNVRAIAAEPGLAGLVVGAGTLNGVFSTTNAAGERVRDQAAIDKANADILAACKEFKLTCGYPVNNSAEMERYLGMGFRLMSLQQRNQAAFDAVITGRKVSGRPTTTP
jgi:2-keto-3-deoxy-L-rhamnonate aldolase RhmA